MYQPRPGLVEEMQLQDAIKMKNVARGPNRLVYDSMEPGTEGDLKLFGKQGIYKGGLGNCDPAEVSPSRPLVSNLGIAGSQAMDPLTEEVVDLPPFYKVRNPEDKTLVFESRFESGNLRRAIQVLENEYDLILKFDVNTRGHTQWFYFSVSNVRKDVRYRFNIINMLKPDSLYNHGMRPLLYSTKAAQEKRVGWCRAGTDICYFQNRIPRRTSFYYTMTFSLKFEYDNDTVYLAYCYPYSYTDLQKYLLRLEQDPVRSQRFRRRTLCQTLAGNSCDLLTITSFTSDPQVLRARKGVVLSARVHPGESNASWMMKGVIDYLTGPSLDAKILRDNFIFKVVPMLNPDGVINGNYRCSLAGVDLNRRWANPSRKLTPTIHSMKTMMSRFIEDREVVLFCDLHGHSRKKNIFMYGCDNPVDSDIWLKERVFPGLLEEISNTFSFEDCSFRVQRSKESTARIVSWRQLGLINSFTLEASFAGSNIGPLANCHYTIQDLEEMGHSLCDALLEYCRPEESRALLVYDHLLHTIPPEAPLSEEGSTAGSDDSPSGDDRGPVKSSRRKKVAKKKKKRRRGTKKSTGKAGSSSKASAQEKDVSATDSQAPGDRLRRGSRQMGGESKESTSNRPPAAVRTFTWKGGPEDSSAGRSLSRPGDRPLSGAYTARDRVVPRLDSASATPQVFSFQPLTARTEEVNSQRSSSAQRRRHQTRLQFLDPFLDSESGSSANAFLSEETPGEEGRPRPVPSRAGFVANSEAGCHPPSRAESLAFLAGMTSRMERRDVRPLSASRVPPSPTRQSSSALQGGTKPSRGTGSDVETSRRRWQSASTKPLASSSVAPAPPPPPLPPSAPHSVSTAPPSHHELASVAGGPDKTWTSTRDRQIQQLLDQFHEQEQNKVVGHSRRSRSRHLASTRSPSRNVSANSGSSSLLGGALPSTGGGGGMLFSGLLTSQMTAGFGAYAGSSSRASPGLLQGRPPAKDDSCSTGGTSSPSETMLPPKMPRSSSGTNLPRLVPRSNGVLAIPKRK